MSKDPASTEYAIKVIGSIICNCIFLVYGATIGASAAALPELADSLHMSTSKVGLIFTTRGVGYFIGTMVSGALLSSTHTKGLLSQPSMACISLIIIGVSTTIIAGVLNYALLLAMFFIQGLGCGGTDTITNCAIADIWGPRVQSWMQALHAMFGVGAIIGPSLVGVLHYRPCFFLLGALSLIPGLSWGMIILVNTVIVPLDNINLVKSRSNIELMSINSSIHQQTVGDNIISDVVTDIDHVISESLTDTATSIYTSAPESDTRFPDVHVVLTPFASEIDSSTYELARKRSGDVDAAAVVLVTRNNEEPPLPQLPKSVMILIVLLYFLYVGMEVGYSTWIGVFALDRNIAADSAQAAFLIAIFWAGLTVGRIASVIVAMHITASNMLKFHLSVSSATSVAILVFTLSSSRSYRAVAALSAILGYAYSALFPVLMVVVGDYHWAMSSTATTAFIMGSTFGESILPVCIGLSMQFIGAYIMPVEVLCFTSCMVGIWALVNHWGVANQHLASQQQILEAGIQANKLDG